MNKAKIQIRYWVWYLRGKWRSYLNMCPMCNSDAPEVDNCPLCESIRDWTEKKKLKHAWWKEYLRVIKLKRTISKMVIESRRERIKKNGLSKGRTK